MATPASLSPGAGRRAPLKHRCASALGGGCSSGAPARERPRCSTSSRRRSLLRRSWRPRSRGTWLQLGRRYLRIISRRLRTKHRSVNGKGLPTSSTAAVDDDTARERAEAVARAISYCKDTLRRSMPPPPSPSPSLDDWHDDDRDRQEVKIIASAAEQHCDDCRARDSRPSPTRPRRYRDAGRPLGAHTMAKRFKEIESPCSASASPSRDGSLAATAAIAHGEESPHHGHGCRGESMSTLDELEFLKTFDGDEEMIDRHFITVEIPRSGSRVFRKQSPLDIDMKRKIRVSAVVPALNVFQELELEN